MNEGKFKQWLTSVYRESRPKGFDSPNHYAAGIRNINKKLGLSEEGIFEKSTTLSDLEELLKNPLLSKTNLNHLRSLIKFRKYELEKEKQSQLRSISGTLT